jgi:hypothetical protein
MIDLGQQSLILFDDEVLIVPVDLHDLKICFLVCDEQLIPLNQHDDLNLIWKIYFDDDKLELLVENLEKNQKNLFL